MKTGDFVRIVGSDAAALILDVIDCSSSVPKMYEVLALDNHYRQKGSIGALTRNRIRPLVRELTETEQAGLALWRLTHG